MCQVYSPPITSRYASVYWRMMSPVHLPEQLVHRSCILALIAQTNKRLDNRFAGKTMAVVGYEVDQVVVEEGKNDTSVPITHAYNHHYIVGPHPSPLTLHPRAGLDKIKTFRAHSFKFLNFP